MRFPQTLVFAHGPIENHVLVGASSLSGRVFVHWPLDGTPMSSLFGLPDAAKRDQYPLIAPNSARSSALSTYDGGA